MGKEIVIQGKDLTYLTGDLIEISGHTQPISRIEIHPVETTNAIINSFDELLNNFANNAQPETDKFTAYVVTKLGDIFKIDTIDNRKVLIPVTGSPILSIFDEAKDVTKGYDSILQHIVYKARQSSLLDITVSEDFYRTLYRLYYANEQGFLSHYVDWNKDIYNSQLYMLQNQNYPLKLLEVFPNELCMLETNYRKISEHWEALSQANLTLGKQAETMANNMAWFVSKALDMGISEYIYKIAKDDNIYWTLAHDYNSLIGKMRDDQRLRTLFGT